MADPVKLDESEIASELETVPQWSRDGDKITREFTFANFARAFGFMASVAVVVERHGHHPEWFNVYNRVRIDLTTHDAGGLSQYDFDMARRIDELADS